MDRLRVRSRLKRTLTFFGDHWGKCAQKYASGLTLEALDLIRRWADSAAQTHRLHAIAGQTRRTTHSCLIICPERSLKIFLVSSCSQEERTGNMVVRSATKQI